jgi:hypothetical protein
MPESGNPLVVALRLVFGPLVKQSSKWPPVLAYGLPGIVAVLLIVLLRPVLPISVLVTVAVVIIVPLVGYITLGYLDGKAPPGTDDVQQKPNATISQPNKNDIVERTILCSGTATGVQSNMHLWLAVETGETGKVRIWPKEGEVLRDNVNRWSGTIFEDGATKKFSISLFIADPEGDKIIRDWLQAGRVNGEYTSLKGIAGTVRLARVGGLRLKATRLKNKAASV